jgi:transcriptional antiterminator
MSNKMIRRIIRKYIKRYGKQDTRCVITTFSTAFQTTKQRISGNISCMKCIDGTINIIPNKPHSIMY